MSGLHVVGGTIRNGAGQVVQLIGVNRSSAEYECMSNSGIFDGPADQSEVNAMKSWNIKAVRVVLNEDCWLGINGVNARRSPAPTIRTRSRDM
jgi:endoglucanase